MANQVAIAALVLVVAGGAGAAWFFGSSSGGGLDSAGRALVERVSKARRQKSIDKDDCRALLQEIGKHPLAATNRDLLRSRAWLELLVGRTSRAWDLIGTNLGVEATAEDELLGSRVLAQRFNESGDGDTAHRGATLAKSYFDATNDKSSLFLAWQLQLRREDVGRRAELGAALQAVFPASAEARLTKVLVQYPVFREEAPGARTELQALEREFDVIPEELDLALALFESEDDSTLASAVERVERVLRNYPSCIPARTLSGIIAMKKSDWPAAKKIFAALLRRHDDHRRAPFWTKMIEFVDKNLDGK